MKRHSIVEIAANVLQLLSDTISLSMDVSCSLTWVGGTLQIYSCVLRAFEGTWADLYHKCLYLIEKFCTLVGSPLYVFMFTDHKCIMKATSIQHIYSNKLEL